ncbi:MAG: hypothetical protein KKC99_01835 [Proteobacteria bacterium]|nr:hypothetical protein [Pseudomonadota bacterium]
MVTSKDLAGMSFLDALMLSIEQSGLGRRQAIEAMGWSQHHGNRILSTDNYWIGPLDIPEFCRVTGNTLAIDWQYAQAEQFIGPVEFDPVDCQQFIFSMGELFRDLGDLARHGERAAADREIKPHEARQLITDLRTLITNASRLMNGLRAVTGKPEDKER